MMRGPNPPATLGPSFQEKSAREGASDSQKSAALNAPPLALDLCHDVYVIYCLVFLSLFSRLLAVDSHTLDFCTSSSGRLRDS